MAYQRKSDRQFAESKHQYTDPRTKERVTSVTTISEMLDIGNKLRAGAGAAIKLRKEGLDYNDVWRDAGALGSRVHGYCDLFANGREAEIPMADAGYVDAFDHFCEDYKPVWLETERPVVSSHGYGGRFDGIAELRGGLFQGYTLLDVKTGRKWEVPLTLQLTGYKYADGMILYDEDGWAVDLEPMPYIEYCAGLYLADDGTYDLHYVKADDAAFQHFLALLAIQRWAKEQ